MEVHFHSLLFPIDCNNSEPQHLLVLDAEVAEVCSRSSTTNACQCRAISTTPTEQLDIKVPLIYITVRQTLVLCKSHDCQGLSMQTHAVLGTLPQNSQLKPTIMRNPYSLGNPMWQ